MTPRADIDREVTGWARGDPLIEWYATDIWGKRVERDDDMFEVMSLQIFQAGLNWRMILARRDVFREGLPGLANRRGGGDGFQKRGPAATGCVNDPQPQKDRGLHRERPRRSWDPAGARLVLQLVLPRAGG